MSAEFNQPYTESDDISSQANVFCMKCHAPIMGPSYIEMPKRNAPNESVQVYSKKKYSNYALVEVLIEKNGSMSKTFLPVCKDCKNFKMTEENASAIANQIKEATKKDATWNGYPETFLNGINTLKIIRRM